MDALEASGLDRDRALDAGHRCYRTGFSAPRLSTYVNGLVTPSASMMVRFTRVSELAQQQARRVRGSSA